MSISVCSIGFSKTIFSLLENKCPFFSSKYFYLLKVAHKCLAAGERALDKARRWWWLALFFKERHLNRMPSRIFSHIISAYKSVNSWQCNNKIRRVDVVLALTVGCAAFYVDDQQRPPEEQLSALLRWRWKKFRPNLSVAESEDIWYSKCSKKRRMTHQWRRQTLRVATVSTSQNASFCCDGIFRIKYILVAVILFV